MSNSISTTMTWGRLTKDTEVRSTKGGKSVTTVSVAVNTWTGKDKPEKVEFQDWVLWEHKADFFGRNGKKGKQVYLIGRSETRSWDDKNGVTRKKTEFIAQEAFIALSGTNYADKEEDTSLPPRENQGMEEDPLPF